MGDDDADFTLLSRRRFLALAGAAAALAAMRGSVVAAGRGEAPRGTPDRAGLTPSQRASIRTLRIHPGVGVMRVGNSKDAFYFGPEVPGALPPSGTHLRDGSGAVARQAARFRIFGYDAAGAVVGEVTSSDATVVWGAHLANRKAAWYQFSRAMDIPEATSASRRNASVTGSRRQRLVLDAGLRKTSGRHVRCTATAMGVTMSLGELTTDGAGRLVVLPGKGAAKSWNGGGVYTFANNDGWLDDMADGPVTATVRMDGRTLRPDSAWVLSGPPNYAPGIPTGWRTLYDVLEDVWDRAGMANAEATVSFRRHIMPMFTRLARLQWLNAGILRDYGWGSSDRLDSPALLARLADPRASNAAFRTTWSHRFRNLERNTIQRDALPPILGDAAGITSSPRQWIGTTALQRKRLSKWAKGDFLSDGVEEGPVSPRLGDVPLQGRPRALDRAALDGCLADAFLPGCETTWPMRHASMWRKPFRLRERSHAEPDFGSQLSTAEAVSRHGPISGNFPGSVLRWMAVPWMTDTIDCRAGYDPSHDPYLDTFWPARVPNHVLTEADYRTVMDTSRSLDVRRRAFRRRRDWWRGVLDANRSRTLNGMVRNWDRLGFVVMRTGPPDGHFPDRIGVEGSRALREPSASEAAPPNAMPDFDMADEPTG